MLVTSSSTLLSLLFSQVQVLASLRSTFSSCYLLQPEVIYLFTGINQVTLLYLGIGIIQGFLHQINWMSLVFRMFLYRPQKICASNQLIHVCATPSFAIYSRSSSAINRMKFTTYSGFPAETFPELRILGCHTHRTCIQIADTHHHTAHGHQRRRCKSKFLCSQQEPPQPRHGRSLSFPSVSST